MQYTFNTTQNLMKGLLSVYFLALGSILFASSESEVITTIILINRQAELVDISLDGEVMKRHVAVPDYFSSGRSHKSSLKNSLNLLKDYGSIDHALPESSNLSGATLQSYIISEMSNRAICSTTYRSNNNRAPQSEDILYQKDRAESLLIKKMIGSHLKQEKIKKNTIGRKVAFAEIFAPSIDAIYNTQRQHNQRHTRFHRGFFKVT